MEKNYYTIFLLKGKEILNLCSKGEKKVIYYILIITSNIVVSSLSIIVCNFLSYLIPTRYPFFGERKAARFREKETILIAILRFHAEGSTVKMNDNLRGGGLSEGGVGVIAT